MLELKTPVKGDDNSEPETIPVFSIDGTTYSMPAYVKPYVGLRYLWLLKTDGPEFAASWMLAQVLGEDGFAALANYEDLEDDDFETIMRIVSNHALGGEDNAAASKSSKNGAKKSSGLKNTKKT